MKLYYFEFTSNGCRRTYSVHANRIDDAFELLYSRFPDATDVEQV